MFNITDVKSAFTVTNPAAGPTSGTILFSRTVTNIGGVYDTSNGKFICQYPGIYVFHLHIAETWAYCYIRKNGANMIFADTHVQGIVASSNVGSSISVILHLDRLNTVDIGGCSAIDIFWSDWSMSFSGFLLQED